MAVVTSCAYTLLANALQNVLQISLIMYRPVMCFTEEFCHECMSFNSRLVFHKVYSDGGVSHYIDGQSEPENWMKFVNCARHVGEQNLALVQDGDQLFYECCRDISMGEELLVWYGNSYVLSMGIPVGLNVDVAKDKMRQKELTGKCTGHGSILFVVFTTFYHIKFIS